MAKSCECHPWTAEDERIWRIVQQQPRTREQWEALHDAIECYRRLLIDDYTRGAKADGLVCAVRGETRRCL